MDVFEAISKRHCYRGRFTEQPVTRKDLVRIVEAGLKAPSGRNQQTTLFVIIDEPELLKKICAMHPASSAMQTAKALVACIIDRQPDPVYEGYSFQVEDCAAAVENILLAVTALGYATVWIDGWLRVDERAEKLGAMLGVPDNKILRILLPIGVPEEEHKQPAKKPFEKRAWFNRYGV